jgi:hypothetical protein
MTGKAVTHVTPLFLALVLIEIVDVIFAIDSVPAIFAITTDPFVVYTSNILAILELRALARPCEVQDDGAGCRHAQTRPFLLRRARECRRLSGWRHHSSLTAQTVSASEWQRGRQRGTTAWWNARCRPPTWQCRRAPSSAGRLNAGTSTGYEWYNMAATHEETMTNGEDLRSMEHRAKLRTRVVAETTEWEAKNPR